MGFALRCFFFLAILGGLALFLYVYRSKTNQILAIVLFSYGVAVGVRLLSLPPGEDLVWHSLLALLGLFLVWGAIWLGARWVEKHGWPGGD